MEDVPKSDETQISPQPKPRKRVTKACTQCNHAHATCDSNRPCKRCTDRGFPELCKDDFSKKRGKKVKIPEEVPNRYAPPAHPQTTATSSIPQFEPFNIDESAIMNFILSSFDMWPVEPSPSHEPMGGGIEDLADLATRRIPENAGLLSDMFKAGKQRILSIMKERNMPISVDTNAYLEERQDEINQVIETHKVVLEYNSTPFIIFDRTGKIFFVNKSYKSLTGFNYKLPTERGDFYNYVLSPESLYAFLVEIIRTINALDAILEISGFRLKGSVRLHSALAEKYVEGSVSFEKEFKYTGVLDTTHIRDHFGVPLLVVMSFTPTDFPESSLHKFFRE